MIFYLVLYSTGAYYDIERINFQTTLQCFIPVGSLPAKQVATEWFTVCFVLRYDYYINILPPLLLNFVIHVYFSACVCSYSLPENVQFRVYTVFLRLPT